MDKILVISRRKDELSKLVARFTTSEGIKLSWAECGADALAEVSQNTPDLAVIDEDLGDMSGLDLIRQLIAVNPMINTAMISSLPHADFHEASEGLGILAQLPLAPNEVEADYLLRLLGDIKKLNSGR